MHMFQGVVALTDTDANQGGFRCVPSLYQEREAWSRAPRLDRGAKNWLANNIEGREIVHVPARAGDLILWDNRCVMHRRDAFDPATRRVMHRTQIKGDRPY